MTMTKKSTKRSEDEKVVNSEYFRWLCNRVGIGNHSGKTYYCLAYILNEKKFYHIIGNDANRIEDAKKLRDEWIAGFELSNGFSGKFGNEKSSAKDVDAYIFDGEISILELLVSLAIRIETDIMMDDEKGDRTAYWFWLMLENLKLHVYSDDSFSDADMDAIYTILDRLLERDYGEYGDGSIFPTPGYAIGHKDSEIWRQLTAWLNYIYRED